MKKACFLPLMSASFLMFAALQLQAAERVLDFHSEIRVGRDGTLTVTEMITVHAEGRQLSRGLLRELPFEVLSVTRNGAPEPYALERGAGGRRLRTGAPDVLLEFGVHEYRIVYRAGRGIGFFEDHDALHWEVNGYGWALPVERMSAEVRFAEPVPAAALKVEAYTGPRGSRARNYQAFVRHGSAAFRVTRPLAPHEALSVAVAFPKGVVTPPSRAERFDAWAESHPAALAGLGGVLLVTLWALLRLRGQDRNPDPGSA